MSVQLILYPQNYNGQYNAISNIAQEKLVDGINFNSIDASSSYDTSVYPPFVDVINNAYTNNLDIQNTWYRWRTTSTGTPTLPATIAGNLRLYSTTTNTTSGVYQRLSNLVVGQTYQIYLIYSLTGSPTGSLVIASYRDNVPVQTSFTSYAISTGVGWFIHNFTAQSTEDTILISLTNSVTDDLDITNISVLPVGVQPTFTNFDLQDGQVICDLYEHEDIPLTLSVDDFKNVAEKVQSYSKDFDLPATKRNNLIFNNIFDITRNDDGIIFNPYVKTKCVLKQDGFILFDGYLRLIDVTKDKEGEISYSVNLYSEVVALADILKNKTLNDLDLNELAHEYNKTSIKNSWVDSTGLPLTTPLSTSSYAYDPVLGVNNTNVLKYPFVDWEHQILLANGSTGSNATLNFPELTTLEQAFRPFINIKYLMNKIFDDTPFTWSSNFFDTADFGKLFMDFNWGSDNSANQIGSTQYGGVGPGASPATATTSYTNMNLETFVYLTLIAELPPNYDSSTNILTATTLNETYSINYHYNLKNTSGSDADIECQWLHNTQQREYSGVITIPAGTTWIYSGNFQVIMQPTDTLQAQFKASAGSAIEQNVVPFPSFGSSVSFLLSPQNMVNGTILNTLRGELGQWDFLKGILTMFNIISLPDKDDPLNIKFEPYSDVFMLTTIGQSLADRTIQHDWTDKVDVSEMQLTPLTDLNKKTIFKYEEDDDDYTFNVYKKSVGGYLYGSRVFDASSYTLLEGQDEIVASPFATTISKPLAPEFSDFITPAIFTSNDEATEFEGFDNAPRILYNNGVHTLAGSITYYIPAQNGLSSENQDQFLQFSHLTDIPTIPSTPSVQGTKDFNFGECQLFNPIGASVPDNLFNLYWLPYYNELYNPNTRIMTLQVNLNAGDINMFKFNDRVMIKNRAFRVNKIEYKPNSLAKVEFILIP